MALPASGTIKASDIRTELAGSGSLNLGLTIARNLAGKASGEIKYSDFYGKSRVIPQNKVSTSLKEVNLREWALANGWDGNSYFEFTIDPNTYIWSDNINVAALTIDGVWPNGVKVINNGYIIGKGGKGAGPSSTQGYGSTVDGKFAAQDGGPAISLGVNCTIANNGYIAGGGGGGGSGTNTTTSYWHVGGGGGAGGGAGGDGHSYISSTVTIGLIQGPNGGNLGEAGGALPNLPQTTTGGAGGRILPGVGALTQQVTVAGGLVPLNIRRPGLGGGAGGGGGAMVQRYSGDVATVNQGPGGSGGEVGQSGYNGGFQERTGFVFAGGGGGGWGALGGSGYSLSGRIGDTITSLGGSGGKAIALNGYSVTMSGTGTRYGATS